MKRLTLLTYVFLLLMGCAVYLQPIPITPQNYQAEYDKVWNAAIDSLDESGWTPAQMQKADGFVTTEKRIFANPAYGIQEAISMGEAFAISSSNAVPAQMRERIKVTIRFSKENDMTSVKINSYIEHQRGGDAVERD